MPAVVETMFSAREVPWHGLGVVTPDVLTSKEAIIAAGLDWEVEKQPHYRLLNGEFVPVSNAWFNVRTSDNKILGRCVSDEFTNLQNRDAFTFVDNLVDDSGAKYETAGALRGGRVVFMTVKLPKQILIAGDDPMDFYLVFRMGHDGSMAITAEITPIRVVCMNTLKMAAQAATQRWSIRHTNKMEGKLLAARESLRLSFDYMDAFETIGNTLVETRVTDEDLRKLLEDVIPARPTTEERIDQIMGLFNESSTIDPKFRGTGWGAMNAFTEFIDHGRDTKSQEGAFHNIMNGELATQRNNLAQQLLAMA